MFSLGDVLGCESCLLAAQAVTLAGTPDKRAVANTATTTNDHLFAGVSRQLILESLLDIHRENEHAYRNHRLAQLEGREMVAG